MTRGVGGQSSSNVLHYLKGIDFPARKQDLIEQAKKNQAEGEVIQALEGFPDQEYKSMADVMHEYGEVK